MTISFGNVGELDSALAVESDAMLVAARQLDDLGLDAAQKASLFGNVSALFAMKSGLSRGKYLELMKLIWDETVRQKELIETVDDMRVVKGGVA